MKRFLILVAAFFSLSAFADCKIDFRLNQRHELARYDQVVSFCKNALHIFGAEYARCSYLQVDHAKWRADLAVRRVFVGENYTNAWLSLGRYFTQRNLYKYPRNNYQFQFPNCY